MRVLTTACVSVMTLAMAAALTMGAVQAIQPAAAPQLGGSFAVVAEKAKESTPAKAAADKPVPTPKAKAKSAAAPKAVKKVAKTKAAGTKAAGVKAAGTKAAGAKPGACGVGKYYDKKTKACADAAAKKA